MFRKFAFRFALISALLLLWWLLSQEKKDESQPQVKTAEIEIPNADSDEAVEAAQAPPKAARAPRAPDDLRKIEGIGPKISGVLVDAGITTYARLAGMEPDEIRQVLTGGGVRVAVPDSWPEQARLAASGDWEGLQSLQDQLKGGWRV